MMLRGTTLIAGTARLSVHVTACPRVRVLRSADRLTGEFGGLAAARLSPAGALSDRRRDLLLL